MKCLARKGAAIANKFGLYNLSSATKIEAALARC